jgi:hypothetical protein
MKEVVAAVFGSITEQNVMLLWVGTISPAPIFVSLFVFMRHHMCLKSK